MKINIKNGLILSTLALALFSLDSRQVQAQEDFFPTDYIDLPFSDETEIPSYAREAILFLYDENIMRGNADGSFKANVPINRAEFAKLVVEATDTKKYVPLASHFPDVGFDDWFFPYVETARVLGWLGGYPNGTFGAGKNINRAEVAKIFVNAFNLQIEEKEGEGWYGKYFNTLAKYGLLAHGTTPENPEAGVTPSRAEVAEQLHRFVKYKGPSIVRNQMIDDDEAVLEVELQEDNFEESTDSLPTDYEPTQTEKVDYEYIDTSGLSQQVDSSAGKMYIKRIAPPTQKLYVTPNQKKVELLNLNIQTEGGGVKLKEFQIKLSGNGGYDMISRVWIARNGVRISPLVVPSNALVGIKLDKELMLENGTSSEITFYGDIASDAQPSQAIRTVIFLPTWVSANTNKKIGFFPFAGSDIISK